MPFRVSASSTYYVTISGDSVTFPVATSPVDVGQRLTTYSSESIDSQTGVCWGGQANIGSWASNPLPKTYSSFFEARFNNTAPCNTTSHVFYINYYTGGSGGSFPDFLGSATVYRSLSGVWSVQFPPNSPQSFAFTPAFGISTTSPVLLSASGFVDTSFFTWSLVFSLTNFNNLTTFSTSTPISGVFSYSAFQSFSDGYYGGSVCLTPIGYDSLDCQNLSFTVGTSSSGFIPYQTALDSASTTLSSCTGTSTNVFFAPLINFGCFLVIPSPQSISNFTNLTQVAQTKIPFVYFYNIRDIISSSTQATSSPLTDTYLTIGTSTDPFHINVEIFSVNFLRHFLSPEVCAKIRLVTTAILWFELIYYMWHRVPKLFSQSK